METVSTAAEVRACVAKWRMQGCTVGFVPTMGNLHDGHISLLARARATCDRTVVSIFVNPIQFGRGEDYERYPSTLDADGERLRAAGLDLLFTPNLAELYPGGTDRDTRITVPLLENILCGAFRPGHFSGVATVVAKLFITVQPERAYFGEKDYQQVLVVQRMVKDLCMPVAIVAMPIVREPDGLAMSSRNVYLSADQRRLAPVVYATLQQAAEHLAADRISHERIEADGMQLLTEAGLRPEYFSVRRAADLAPPDAADQELIILCAAWLGATRLIDNIRVPAASTEAP